MKAATIIEFGILLTLSHFFTFILAAQPRLTPVDPSTLPGFTMERSVEERMGQEWTLWFTQLNFDLIKPMLDRCATRTGQGLEESVKSVKFLTYRFRAQWPTPNSPVEDYTTQFPTYLFSFQVNGRPEFWHLKVIDLDRCCTVGMNEKEDERGLKSPRIIGLLGQKEINWGLEDFQGNVCPLIKKKYMKLKGGKGKEELVKSGENP